METSKLIARTIVLTVLTGAIVALGYAVITNPIIGVAMLIAVGIGLAALGLGFAVAIGWPLYD